MQHIQTINYEDGLSTGSLLSFLSLFTFFILFFYALTSLNDYFSKIKRSKSFDDLNEHEKQILKITKHNTKINSQKIIVSSPMEKKKKNPTRSKSVFIEELKNQYFLIDPTQKPCINCS